MTEKGKVVLSSLILSCGLVAAAYSLSRFYLKLETDKVVSVKGYAVQRVESDLAKCHISIETRNSVLPSAYEKLDADSGKLLDIVRGLGIAESEIEIGNIRLVKVYKLLAGKKTNEIEYYIINRKFGITSGNVKLVQQAMQEASKLLATGVEVSISNPEFLVTDLDEIKLSVLAKATENGYSRAQLMAQNSGGKVGKLVEARQGVFQITEPNSTKVSSYGCYDTSTIAKDVKAVVTLEYIID